MVLHERNSTGEEIESNVGPAVEGGNKFNLRATLKENKY